VFSCQHAPVHNTRAKVKLKVKESRPSTKTVRTDCRMWPIYRPVIYILRDYSAISLADQLCLPDDRSKNIVDSLPFRFAKFCKTSACHCMRSCKKSNEVRYSACSVVKKWKSDLESQSLLTILRVIRGSAYSASCPLTGDCMPTMFGRRPQVIPFTDNTNDRTADKVTERTIT